MRQILLLTFLLGAGVLAAPSSITTYTPTCEVKAVSSTLRYWPGRLVTITPVNCPENGRAYVRYRSRTGSQPDAPPGYFTLRAGQELTRRVPADWWVERRNKVLQWLRVAFTPKGSGL